MTGNRHEVHQMATMAYDERLVTRMRRMDTNETVRDLSVGAIASPATFAKARTNQNSRACTQQRQQQEQQQEQQRRRQSNERLRRDHVQQRQEQRQATDDGAGKCPGCGTDEAFRDHVFWTCPGRAAAAAAATKKLPQRPTNPLQRRYGWPTTGKKKNDQRVLSWMEFAVEKMWTSRHGINMEEQRHRILSARERAKAKEAEKNKWVYESSTDEESD